MLSAGRLLAEQLLVGLLLAIQFFAVTIPIGQLLAKTISRRDNSSPYNCSLVV